MDLQALQLAGQFRRHGGEGLGLGVVGQLAAGESLADDVALVPLVLRGHPEHSGRSAEFVPRRVDRAANHPGAGVGGPEDHRVVAGAERRVAAAGCTPGSFVDGRETQVAVGRATQRLVLRQDRALHEVRAGLRGEEHLAGDEVLGETVADGIDLALPRPERAAVAAAGLPRRGDRVVGFHLRLGECDRGRQHHRRHRQQPDDQAADPSPTPGPVPAHPILPRSARNS